MRDGCYVVTNGLTEGDRVIIEGLQKVRPGMAVDAVAAAPAAGGTFSLGILSVTV